MAQRAISLPFSFDSSGGVTYTTDEVKIWQDRIAIVVMTRLNERVMRPTYGSNTQKVALENFNSAVIMAKQEVATALSTWLPSVTLVSVDGIRDPENPDRLNIEIVFKYGNSNEATVLIKTAILNRAGETILEVTNG